MNIKVLYSRNRGFKIFLTIVAVIVIFIAGAIGYIYNFMYPQRDIVKEPNYSLKLEATLSREKATQDLQYLVDHLKDYHPAYVDGSDHLTSAIEAQYQTELQSLKVEVTVLELWRAAARIASSLRDGHTNIWYNSPEEDRFISDFTQVLEYGVPAKIDGIDTEIILETLKRQYSYEREAYVENKFYHTLILSEQYLNYCGIDTSDGVVFTYAMDEGETEYSYDFVTVDQVIGYKEEDNTEWVYYDLDTKNNLAVFSLTGCKYNDEYLSVLDQFFHEVDENSITNIAVDLRGNGGGNSRVASAFLEYVNVDTYNTWDSAVRYGWYLIKNTDVECKNQKKKVVFDGDIYVLMNIRTYSSAMDFAMLIGDNGIGKLVGETSGNMPNSYGDCLGFQLPNSKLCMSVSFKKWYRVDKTKSEEPLEPDYAVSSSEALNKVYELIKP